MSTDQTTEVTESVETTANPTEQGTDTQPKLTAEQKKAQILESFEERLDKGELTLEEVENRQPWVAEAIKAKKQKAEEVLPDTSKLKSDLKTEILEEIEVKSTLTQVYSIANKAQREEFDATVAELEKEGLSKSKAINLAARASGIDLSQQASQRRSLNHPSFGDVDTEAKLRVTESDRRMAKTMGVDPETVAKSRVALEAKL